MSQPSSADCLAALVASVIERLRREEAGQATVFSKRAFSHFFSGAAQAEICTICVPVAVPILYGLITLLGQYLAHTKVVSSLPFFGVPLEPPFVLVDTDTSSEARGIATWSGYRMETYVTRF